MLPKNVISLISNYNEPGIFVLNKTANIQKLYWFNGKRFELWCKTESWTWIVFTYENEVYRPSCGEHGLQKYKNKQFVEFKPPNKWNHPLYLFSIHGYQQTVCCQNIYRRSLNYGEMFDGHQVHPLLSYGRSGCFLFSYNDNVYTFDPDTFTKFSPTTKKWKVLNPSPFPGLLYFFNDICYCFAVYGHNDEYSVYDRKTNQWTIKKINLKNEN